MRDVRLFMVDRVEPDGTIEAEPVFAVPAGNGMTLVLDDGTELRIHATDWDELTERPAA